MQRVLPTAVRWGCPVLRLDAAMREPCTLRHDAHRCTNSGHGQVGGNDPIGCVRPSPRVPSRHPLTVWIRDVFHEKPHTARLWAEIHSPRVDPDRAPPLRDAVAIGSCAGLAVGALSLADHVLGGAGVESALLLGSFGSTAAILFMVPESPFSQPREVVGGHTLSATVGVAVAQLAALPMALPAAAAPTAVAVATVAMLKTRTMHPPAAGTALAVALAVDGPLFQAGLAGVAQVGLASWLLVGTAVVLNRAVFPRGTYPSRWR